MVSSGIVKKGIPMGTIIYAGKWAEAFLLVVFVFTIWHVCILGKRLVSQRLSSGGRYGPSTRKAVKRWSAVSYALLILLILGAKTLAYLAHADPWSDSLFWVHLAFAVPTLGLATTIQFWKSGEQDLEAHKSLVKYYLVFLFGTVLSGALLLIDL